MKVHVESAHLNGLLVLRHEVFEDERGFFMESYRADLFREAGIPWPFVQDNHSRSAKGVVRGLHFQWEPPMGKLVRVTRGRAFLVAVDIRRGSPTLGEWHAVTLGEDDRKQVWAPAGFARGFASLTDQCEIQYKCTGVYGPSGEGNILWNDPAIGIAWPVEDPALSARDLRAPTLAQWLATPAAERFHYQQP